MIEINHQIIDKAVSEAFGQWLREVIEKTFCYISIDGSSIVVGVGDYEDFQKEFKLRDILTDLSVDSGNESEPTAGLMIIKGMVEELLNARKK